MPDKKKLGKIEETGRKEEIKPFNTIKSNSSFATPGTEFKPTNPGTNNQPARETSSDRAKDAVKKVLTSAVIGASPFNNLGFIKAKTLEKNPNAKTMMVDGKEMPIQMKGSPYMLYGKETSPMTMKGGSPLAKYGCSKK